MDVWGSRRFRVRGAVALAAIAALAIVMGSCDFNRAPSDPKAIVEHFTQLMDDRDASGAAELTSYPAGAESVLKSMFDGLDPGKPDYKLVQFIDLDGDTAMFNLKAHWNFGPGKDWNYDLQGNLRKLSTGWKISWDPAVVMPQLDNKRTVKLVRTDAKPAPKVNDKDGRPLLSEQVINVIKLDPAKMPDPVASTDALADAIAPVAPVITGRSLRDDLAKSGGKPVTAVSLREGDFAILEPKMAAVPGVVMEKQPKLIVQDRRVWSPLTDALENVWQDSLDEHAGWGVQLFEPDGTLVTQLAGFQGPPGPDIASTMDQKLQRAAEDAVVSVGTAASVVAIQPSTGAILAAAQNNYAQAEGTPAFTASYPVGGTADLFKAVASIVKKKAPQDVSVNDTAEAAAMLGVGIGFDVPGLEATTGKLPISGRGVDKVRQGTKDPILASPYGMALAAAAISRGSVPAPMIEIGRPGTTDADIEPLPSAAVEKLRAMLRDATAAPQEAPVSHYAGVTAFTASAGDDGWLLASAGDLAFAVHIKDIDAGNATSRLAAVMLKSLATPDDDK